MNYVQSGTAHTMPIEKFFNGSGAASTAKDSVLESRIAQAVGLAGYLEERDLALRGCADKLIGAEPQAPNTSPVNGVISGQQPLLDQLDNALSRIGRASDRISQTLDRFRSAI